jgi:hypothetical protein
MLCGAATAVELVPAELAPVGLDEPELLHAAAAAIRVTVTATLAARGGQRSFDISSSFGR